MKPSKLEAFWDIWRKLTTIDEDGEAGLMHGVVMRDDGEVSILALDLSPEQIWPTMNAQIADLTVCEVVFGIDRFSQEGQGVETASLVTVYWWRREGDQDLGWRFGILPYDKDHREEEVEWDHPFWKPIQQDEVENIHREGMEAALRRLNACGVSADGLPMLAAELRKLKRAPQRSDMEEIIGRLRQEYPA